MALYAFDGTWNEADYDFADGDTNTNVLKFAQAYALCYGEDEGLISEQYLEGVGTRFGKIGKVIGGLTGAGGRSRVDEMLELCAKEFEEGDRTVDIVGFSRGAALALHFANKLSDGVRVNGKKLKVESIRFLGLWDTVPAFGLPGAIIDWAKDINIGWDLDLPPRVQLCCHALARHERRQAFDVHRLDPKHKKANVKELWFRGVHSDIGGGNNNISLNSISLHWMMSQARAAGIPFGDEQLREVEELQNPAASTFVNDDRFDQIDREYYEGDQLHSSAARRLAVGESKLVPVDSRLLFDYSGLMVESGDQYIFEPDPEGVWYDKDIECTSGGWPDDLIRGDRWAARIKENLLESRMVGWLRRLREAKWFEMCVCVGFDDDYAVPIGRGQFHRHVWQTERSGPLNFFANDSDLPNLYGNNRGRLSVKVTRRR